MYKPLFSFSLKNFIISQAMLQPDFSLGPLTFHLYGVFIFLGLLLLRSYLKANCAKYNLPFSHVESAFIISLIFALFGARFYHVLSNFSYYSQHWNETFSVWQGGLGIFGVISGGITGIAIYSHLKHLNLGNLLDLIFPPLLLVQAIGRLGNFFNSEGFGPPTNLPWKIFIPMSNRPSQYLNFTYFHPTFFYESALCLFAFALFFFLQKKLRRFGFGFAYYLISYGSIRFFTEFLRIDSWVISKIHVGQVLSLVMVFGGILFFKKYLRFQKKIDSF